MKNPFFEKRCRYSIPKIVSGCLLIDDWFSPICRSSLAEESVVPEMEQLLQQ